MPKNEGGLGAGDREMSSAARLHGQPLMRLNKLVRWYISWGFVFLALVPLLIVLNIFTPAFGAGFSTPMIVLVLHAGFVLFAGGLAIKFLPSSMGGNPHVYSLPLALWSFWFLMGGTAAGLLGIVVPPLASLDLHPALPMTSVIIQSLGLLLACGLLLFNISKTMESRV